MRNTDQYSSLFWLFAGAGITLMSLKYGFGTFHEPGLGFTTFWAGLILTCLSLVIFFSSSRPSKNRGGLRELWAGLEVEKVIYVIALLSAYALVLRRVGFLISTFILLFLLFRMTGAYRLRTNLIMSFLITAGSYIVFEVWLQTQLPKGILERFI